MNNTANHINDDINQDDLAVVNWHQIQSRPFMMPLKKEMLSSDGYLVISRKTKLRFKPHLEKARYRVKYDRHYVTGYLAYHLLPLIEHDLKLLHKLIDEVASNDNF